MDEIQKNNPLYKKTLKSILTELVDECGWEYLHHCVPVQCFYKDPSISSSLKFLRRHQWARDKIEELYIWKFSEEEE